MPNQCFFVIFAEKYQFDLGKHNVFWTRFRQLKKPSFSKRDLPFRVVENAFRKHRISKGQINVFLWFSPKSTNLTLGNVTFLERVFDNSKNQVSPWETWFFQLSKTRSKNVTFPKVKFVFFGENHKTLIWLLEIQCFRNAFSTTQKGKFPMTKLGFLSCRKRVPEMVCFPRSK